MKINKMIFINYSKGIKELEKYGIPGFSKEYGDDVITQDFINQAIADILNEDITYIEKARKYYTIPVFNDTLEKGLGHEVIQLLKDGELDYVKVNYDREVKVL